MQYFPDLLVSYGSSIFDMETLTQERDTCLEYKDQYLVLTPTQEVTLGKFFISFAVLYSSCIQYLRTSISKFLILNLSMSNHLSKLIVLSLKCVSNGRMVLYNPDRNLIEILLILILKEALCIQMVTSDFEVNTSLLVPLPLLPPPTRSLSLK